MEMVCNTNLRHGVKMRNGKTIMKVQNVETLNLNDSGVLLPVESQDE